MPQTGAPPATRGADQRNTIALTAFTAVTGLADGVAKVSLPLLATRVTTSPLLVTGVALTLTLPWLLTALHVGVLVDRLDRRRLLVGANAARVLAVAALLAAVALVPVGLPLLYGVGIVLGVAEVVAMTASAALVPSAVGAAGRDRANSWMTAAETVCTEFAGPFVGGLLVAVGYLAALGASAAAYVVTLALPLLLIGRFRPERSLGEAPPTRGAVTEGLRFLWANPVLRTMALTLTVLCLSWGAWLALLPLLAARSPEIGPTGYGLILSGLGLGGMVGAVATVPLNRLLGRRLVMFVDLVGTLVMVAAPVLTAQPLLLGAAAFVGGLGGTLWQVNARTLVQGLVPAALMGRFHAAWRLLSWGALPVGAFTVGLLGELLGPRLAFVPYAVAVVALTVPFLRVLTPSAVAAAERAALDTPS